MIAAEMLILAALAVPPGEMAVDHGDVSHMRHRVDVALDERSRRIVHIDDLQATVAVRHIRVTVGDHHASRPLR